VLQIVNPPQVYNGAVATQVELHIELWASYVCKFFVKDIAFLADDTPMRNHLVSTQPNMHYDVALGIYFQGGTLVSGDDVVWDGDGRYSDPIGVPGLFWGFSSWYGGGVIGQLAGYGFNKVSQARVDVFDTNLAALTTQALNGASPFVNCTLTNTLTEQVPGIGTASSMIGSGTNVRAHTSWIVAINQPGELQTPTWQSDDRLWFVDHDGVVRLMTYDASREFIWLMNPCNLTSGVTSLTADNAERFTFAIESMQGFDLLSPAIKPGPATVEGQVREKFTKMSNDDRARFDGKWQKYLQYVRSKRKPDPKPLPDYFKEFKDAVPLKELKQLPPGKKKMPVPVHVDGAEEEVKFEMVSLTRVVDKLLEDDDVVTRPVTPASRAGSTKSSRSVGGDKRRAS